MYENENYETMAFGARWKNYPFIFYKFLFSDLDYKIVNKTRY